MLYKNLQHEYAILVLKNTQIFLNTESRNLTSDLNSKIIETYLNQLFIFITYAVTEQKIPPPPLKT